MVFCYLANLFMLPALFMPTDADALLQLRLLLILASPFFCAVLMFSYFGKVLKITAWRRPVYILAVPFGLMALTATVLALVPGQQMTPEFCRWFFSLGGILGAFFSYVNRCRLSHAAQLQAEHPDWPLSAVIADSGFASRTTYYKVRRQLEN